MKQWGRKSLDEFGSAVSGVFLPLDWLDGHFEQTSMLKFEDLLVYEFTQ